MLIIPSQKRKKKSFVLYMCGCATQSCGSDVLMSIILWLFIFFRYKVCLNLIMWTNNIDWTNKWDRRLGLLENAPSNWFSNGAVIGEVLDQFQITDASLITISWVFHWLWHLSYLITLSWAIFLRSSSFYKNMKINGSLITAWSVNI